MKIIIYGINYAPELTGIGKYSGEMAVWLAKQGHEVRVVCAPPYYPEWAIGNDYQAGAYLTEKIQGVDVFRCPLYVPKQPKTFSRLIHLASFAISSFPVILRQYIWHPEVVICVEPTFFCTPATLLLAKLTGAKSVLHIQDYELDAMLGLGMGQSGRFSRFAQAIERFVMCQFTSISSISVNMLQLAADKMENQANLILFPNWVDIDFVTPTMNADYFRVKWNIPVSTKIVLYSGNMGKKQGLELVLDAALRFSSEPNVLFIFVGTGAALDELKLRAKKLQLRNTHFYPLQVYTNLPFLMALADVHLVIQKKGVADAVLPSKLTTILSAGGQALITAEPNTELGLLCVNYPGIAVCVKPEQLSDFTVALSELLSQVDVNNRQYNQVARDYAEQFLGKEQVLRKFEKDLLNLSEISV